MHKLKFFSKRRTGVLRGGEVERKTTSSSRREKTQKLEVRRVREKEGASEMATTAASGGFSLPVTRSVAPPFSIAEFDLFLMGLDGVLINTDELTYKAWGRAFQERGIPFNFTFDDYVVLKDDRSWAQIVIDLLASHNVDVTFAELRERRRAYFWSMLDSAKLHFKKGAEELIKALVSRRFAIVTRSSMLEYRRGDRVIAIESNARGIAAIILNKTVPADDKMAVVVTPVLSETANRLRATHPNAFWVKDLSQLFFLPGPLSGPSVGPDTVSSVTVSTPAGQKSSVVGPQTVRDPFVGPETVPSVGPETDAGAFMTLGRERVVPSGCPAESVLERARAGPGEAGVDEKAAMGAMVQDSGVATVGLGPGGTGHIITTMGGAFMVPPDIRPSALNAPSGLEGGFRTAHAKSADGHDEAVDEMEEHRAVEKGTMGFRTTHMKHVDNQDTEVVDEMIEGRALERGDRA
ncbi:hypothetical protein CBR_g39252 [Chara braunii]|uniref:Uncharacterized protein n=1 Tax=Chara braunii TaxID=69332 RepID=A0A388K0W9_CHABU|nr:hypothetical protein CBR_g39252 [Chara braunii]|eukprot:GBG63710.1 hypothetical protein CBR_g39252 [Chara braunii]